MSEAIKVEVGQTWKTESETVTIYSIVGHEIRVCDDGQVDPTDGWTHDGTCCWRFPIWFDSARLVSPAPAKVETDRSGCKAWCGLLAREALKPSGRDRWYHFDDFGGKGQRWCAPTCRDAKYPPMGEAKPRDQQVKELQASIEATLKKVDRPEPAKAPKCGWSGANHTGAVLLRVARTGEAVTVCDGCWLSNEAVIADNVGGGIAPYTGPERLPPKSLPPLAVDWIWDTLPDGGR